MAAYPSTLHDPPGAMTADGKDLPKYARVAAALRGQVADGTLRPGQPAPSGAALSRVTGFSTLTCRRALRLLIADGVLILGPSRNARPRVAGPPQHPAQRDLAAAARALAAGLAGRRRANGLTQPQLARRVGVSVTTVGHAETGRLWQSRQFWERADAVLAANGDLLRLHDDFRAASASEATSEPGTARPGQRAAGGQSGGPPAPPPAAQPPDQPSAPRAGLAGWAPGQRQAEDAAVTAGAPAEALLAECAAAAPGQAGEADHGPACVMIVWGDGTVTTVHPPSAAPAQAALTDAP